MKSKLLIVFIFIVNCLPAQNIFQKVIGLGNPGHALSFCVTNDTLVGTCAGRLFKADSCGNIIWVNKYLPASIYKAGKIFSLSNGGYVMLVEMIANGFGSGDIMVFNMDKDGLIEWIKYFGTDDYDAPSDMVELPDGDIVITGQTRTNLHNGKELLLMRINKYGDQYWQRTYGTSSDADKPQKLLKSFFGGFVIAGEMALMKNILRTDDNGNVKWNFSYGEGTLSDMAENSINGDLFVCGNTVNNLKGESSIFVMRTDSSGNVLWAKIMGNDNSEKAYTLSCNQDFSSIYIAGEYQADTAQKADAFAACLNADDGGLLWAKLYGTSQVDVFYDNLVFKENSLLNIGYSEGFDSVFQNVYLVRTNLNGTSGCMESSLVCSIDSTLNILPDSMFITVDTVDLWVSSVCYPPSLIAPQQLTLCTTESMDETEEFAVRVYPNPAEDYLIIDCHLETGEIIELYNETGQRVPFCFTSNEEYVRIGTADLSPGIYLVKIAGEGRLITQKIIIR
ncbi:MAG: T9SS type A sorting domain-containing protein [Bacteroidales bacterium]|jgi:hypothetical protein|nr:T9SS type A sorting domain-containing protein [Bacteroidales bacterium]